MKRRTKQNGRIMNEIQRQTTEKVHKPKKIKISNVTSEYTFDCPKCGSIGIGEEGLNGTFWEDCLSCGYSNDNML